MDLFSRELFSRRPEHPFQFVAEYCGAKGLEKRKAEITKELEAVENTELAQDHAELVALRKAFIDNEQGQKSSSTSIALGNQVSELEDRLKSKYGPERFRRFEFLAYQIETMETTEEARFQTFESNSILSKILEVATNTSAHIPFDQMLTFQEQENLYSKSAGGALLTSTDLFKIPVGMFVGTARFQDWSGIARTTSAVNGVKIHDGREKIKDFASRPTEISINDVTIHLLADGRALFISNNSHRLLAAVRKGDTNIRFRGSATILVFKNEPSELTKFDLSAPLLGQGLVGMAKNRQPNMSLGR